MKLSLVASVSGSVLAAAGLCATGAHAQTAPQTQVAAQGAQAQSAQAADQAPAVNSDSGVASPSATIQTVVVTGSTSKRTLLNASVAVTDVTQQQLLEKAPRGTDDILETIPGIFVQATAGPVSNNYSVRGLPGGGQEFIRLEEDGMPIIYGGLNDDEVFQYDLSIGHVEGLVGGTSGILTPNAAGASINFISRPLNYDQGGGLVRALGASYGEGRADFWYSAPLAIGNLQNVAFAISGYYDSTPGVRDSEFRYDTYHIKGQLEKKFDSGGYIRITYKRWDEHDPYYADQPYAYNNGKISSVPSLGTQFGNIIGSDFATISQPDSCYTSQCAREFSESQGIHEQGDEYRIDVDKPITRDFGVFARVRYTQTNWDFNGVFAGSGSGNGGLTSAVDYLNPGFEPGTTTAISPIQSLLLQGQAAFPNATQFGIRNINTGAITPASNTAALNALNGNGLLEQTVLNRQFIKIRDWGSDFGGKWNLSGDHWSNSLTFGGMFYSQYQGNDQSGVSTVINDVTNDSNIYDIVALNSAGSVVGQLTNTGQISYGDWGSGISNYQLDSESAYFNDEFTFANKLHIDVGVRYEHEHESLNQGGSAVLAVPANTPGIIATDPDGFNGTYTNTSGSENPVNWTVGVNYTFTPNFSVYGRYADSYQTGGVNTDPTELILYEAGITGSKFGVLATVRGFRTEFKNYSGGGGVVPSDPNLDQGFFANIIANGATFDVTYRPQWEPLRPLSIQVQGIYQDSTFTNASTGVIEIGGVNISQQVATFYDGKTPSLTPKWLVTVQPTYDLPGDRGSIYARYKYIDSIFADNGNALALPSYGILSLGVIYNITRRLQADVNVDNVTNQLGLTEGNPRQGFTQSVVSGYFYGRGIIGPNAQFSLTYKF